MDWCTFPIRLTGSQNTCMRCPVFQKANLMTRWIQLRKPWIGSNRAAPSQVIFNCLRSKQKRLAIQSYRVADNLPAVVHESISPKLTILRQFRARKSVKSRCPVTALSLTTPTVSRDFILIFSVHEHTFPMARESRLCGCLVSLVSPQLARAVSASSLRCCPPNISSVTIDHDELCDLPAGRRVA